MISLPLHQPLFPYLVETPKGYGVALINEYASQKEDTSLWNKEMPLYWKAICEDADIISCHPEFEGAEIFVGEFSGCGECHELAVIFPAATDPAVFAAAASKLEDLAYASVGKYIWTRTPVKYRCNKEFKIEDNIIGNSGDVIEVYDALPGDGETAAAVAGYCDIFNHTTGQLWNTTWGEVEGSFCLTRVEEPIVSYYECQIGQTSGDGSTRSVCIRGERIPTVGEAYEFLAEDIANLHDGAPVISVRPISAEEAHDSFDIENRETPIFR